LLEDLRKTVSFVQNTINPALDYLTLDERNASLKVLTRESENLLDEINRLEREREMQERRLSNVMHLVCGNYYIFMQVTN
jgi:hypothetical protein